MISYNSLPLNLLASFEILLGCGKWLLADFIAFEVSNPSFRNFSKFEMLNDLHQICSFQKNF